MNEAEVLEILALESSNALTAFTIYISFTFAFLTASHFVGRDLSRTQVLVLCFVYIVSAAAGAGATLANIDAMVVLFSEYPNIWSKRPLWQMENWTIYMSIVFFLGVVGSIVFLIDVRRNN